jgi:hypothetical protein
VLEHSICQPPGAGKGAVPTSGWLHRKDGFALVCSRTQIIEAPDFEKKSEKNSIDFRSLFLYSLADTT